MIRIKNALTEYRNPITGKAIIDVDCFDYFSNIPTVKNGYLNEEIREILELYFTLVYNTFNLVKKVEEWGAQSGDGLDELRKKLVPAGKVDKGFLLKLLIIRPDSEDINSILGLIPPDVDLGPLKKCFNYKSFSEKKEFAELVMRLKVNVCPYCGRAFTGTVKRKKGGHVRTNQIDHFLPKAQYPHLSLSLWNLVPVCGSCNNRKGDDTVKLPYPYAEGYGDLIRFVIKEDKLISMSGGCEFNVGFDTFPIKYSEEEASLSAKAKAEDELFSLSEIYSTHSEYLFFLVQQRILFPDSYIDSLIWSFPTLFKTREDVRSLLYMKRINADMIGSFPLDKLTRDIDMQINEYLTLGKVQELNK